MGSKDKRDSTGQPLDSSRPTVRPVEPLEGLPAEPDGRLTPVHAAREPQVTVTNEVELEKARVQSIGTPVPTPTPLITGLPGANPASAPGAEMREFFGLGDYTGALEHAEAILAVTPDDVDAARIAADCRQTLAELYEAKLGPLDRVPFVVVARDELRWLTIDHRAGFLLSHVDGVSSLETILDVSGMHRLDALRVLVELVQKRVVALR